MPLDTSIPLQVQIPQFAEPIDPATRQYNALRQQALQQEMMRNQLIMQNTMEDRRREEANRRLAAATAAAEQRRKEELMGIYSQFGVTPAAIGQRGASYSGTGVSTNPFEPVRNQLVQKGFLSQAADVAELENKTLTGAKAKAELPGIEAESRKKGVEADTAQDAADWDMYRRGALAVMREGDLTPIITGVFNHPRLGAKLKQLYPDVTSALAAAEDLRANNPQGFAAMFMANKDQFDKMVEAAVKPTVAAPALNKGEVWNEEQQRVEAIPGSNIYIQQSQKHGKDFGALNYLDAKTNLTNETIDRILSKENESGFSGNFGGYNAYATRLLPGNTQKVAAELDTLKSEITSVGLEMMRQGGSIGAMTEREWPLLERMIASLKPTLDEADARDLLNRIRTKLDTIRETAKETYATTWGNTQYYKSGAGGKTSSASPSGGANAAPSGFEGWSHEVIKGK